MLFFIQKILSFNLGVAFLKSLSILIIFKDGSLSYLKIDALIHFRILGLYSQYKEYKKTCCHRNTKCLEFSYHF